MCGFVGVLRPPSAGSVTEAEMKALLPWIRHRGPDQEGLLVLGDLGLAAARLRIRGGDEGNQPLVAEDGRTIVAFNGELFFQPAVHGGTDRCDTPVFLDEDGLDDDVLVGNMGALARYHVDEVRLDLARDPLGIKPLHVAELDDGSVWFASELKVLLKAVPALRRPDRLGLSELLQFHRPRTALPFHGVEALPCGHDEEPVTERLAGEAAVDAVRRAWRGAAEHAADVDGPVSLLLSGGLDSSAVAAWAGRDDLLCLTGRFEGEAFDESEAAAAVAAHVGLEHEIVSLRDEDLVADLPDVIAALEMPIAGPGSLSLWRMAKRARAHGRVVLTGTGGDELFGGYARTALALGKAGRWTRGYEPLRSRIEAAGGDPSARLRAAFDRATDLRGVMHPDFVSMLPDPAPLQVGEDETLLEALLQEERRGTLASLLHVEDRVTMAHGLEGRPVACLGRLPYVARRLHADWLIGPDGEGKRSLRAALEGAIPESVRTDPRKRGFPTPFARAARGAGRERIADWLGEQRFRERGWWNVDACLALLDEDRPGYDRALFAVLSWEWWARLFLDGDLFEGTTHA